MPTIQLHPRSLVLGLAIGASALFALAQSAPQYASTVRVQYMPHPRDMVQIEEGTPYTVPAGKILVVTDFGATAKAFFPVVLSVNGQGSLQVDGTASTTSPLISAGRCFAVPTGSVVDVDALSGSVPAGRAWGYLADQ